MNRWIDKDKAEMAMPEILRAASHAGDRFIVRSDDGPPVIILGFRDYLRSIKPPEWLEAAWDRARANGTDQMSMDDIDAEIAAYRREQSLTHGE